MHHIPTKNNITKYWMILVAEIFLIVVATFMFKHLVLALLFAIGMLSLIGFTIKTIFEFKFLRAISMTCGVVAAISGLVWFIPDTSIRVIHLSLLICCTFYSFFILTAIYAVGRHVFVTDVVTANKIIGSICLYLLIGIFFAFVYAVLSLSIADSFVLNGSPIDLDSVGLREFLYFSFSTLTTTGFGDMIPKNPATRMVSNFESITGAIYLAIVVARLVGMHVTHATQGKGPAER